MGKKICQARFDPVKKRAIVEFPEESPLTFDTENPIELVEVSPGVYARFDRAKGILIDPPFGPWEKKT